MNLQFSFFSSNMSKEIQHERNFEFQYLKWNDYEIFHRLTTASVIGEIKRNNWIVYNFRIEDTYNCDEIVEWMSENTSLEGIDIEHSSNDEELCNVIKTIKPSLTTLSIRASASENQALSTLALVELLRGKNSLKHIRLCHLDAKDVGVVVRALCGIDKLESLEIDAPTHVPDADDEQSVDYSVEVSKALAGLLSGHQTLLSVSIGIDCCDIGATYIADALKSNNVIQELCLRLRSVSDIFHFDNMIFNGPANIIADAMYTNKSIRSLDLRGSYLMDECIIALANALKSNKIITKLNLSDNRCTKDGLLAIADLFLMNTPLTDVDISLFFIGDDNDEMCKAAFVLMESFEFNTNIKQISLAENCLDEQSLSRFAKSIRANKTLTHIDLSINYICTAQMMELANAINSHHSLTHVKFSQIPVTPCPVNVHDILTQFNRIVHLDLHNNRIELEGARAISELLKTNPYLEFLDISQTEMVATGGITLIIDALCSNTTLRYLDVSRPKYGLFSKAIVDGVCKMIRENHSLHTLKFIECGLSSDSIDMISHALCENTSITLLNVYTGVVEKTPMTRSLKRIFRYCIRNRKLQLKTKLAILHRISRLSPDMIRLVKEHLQV